MKAQRKTQYQITQADLEEFRAIKARIKELTFAMKVSIEARGDLAVEPGTLTAKLIEISRTSPDFKGYIARKFGEGIVKQIIAATKPTTYNKLDVKAS